MTGFSSSVRLARQALADRLREIRVQAGLTAKDLADGAGWHRTKVSKLEHAATSPTAADIRTWCNLCGVSDLAHELVHELQAADSLWLDWRRMERAGLKPAQESVRQLYENTRLFRFYTSQLIPGPVQTAEYVHALLSTIRDRRGLIDDVADAVAERMDRQRSLFAGDHRFAVLLEEATLYHRIGGVEVLAGQLRHLFSVADLPAVSLGVIPRIADRSVMWPVEMFFIFDDRQVNVELVSGFLTITQPREIAMYVKGFAQLATSAVYGASAKQLITDALQELGRCQ
ncbi:MAG: transcriptional regulator [Actinobacteria bacterium 13_1_20CM_3_71_11]|nr:MAG: transcriptional regulator [Actinobacteria bacterium 13_1_20CM_3_71_11]